MLQVIEENVYRPALRLLRQCRVFEI
jgi:hypothetical protein